MGARKKFLLRFLGIFGILLALAASGLVFSTRYLNSPEVREKIEAVLSRKLGGTVRYERLVLSLFPLPRITAVNPKLAIPAFTGTLKDFTVYPRILPLMRGKTFISRIFLRDPDFIVAVREGAVQTRPPSLPEVKAGIRSVLASLNAVAPGLVIDIDNGRLVLYQQKHRFLSLRSVFARFTALPTGVAMKARAKSESWGAVSLSGAWTFDEEKAEVKELTGTLGRSSFSGVSARLTWRKPLRLDVLSGSAVFSLDELSGWLRSSEYQAPFLKDVKTLSGTIRLSSISAGGPLLQPGAWRVFLAGTAHGVTIDTPLLPGPLAVQTGAFTAAPRKFSFHNVRAKILDSSFSLSGSLRGTGTSLAAVKLSGSGVAGPESVRWTFARFSLPEKFLVNAPLSFSGAGVQWEKGAGTAFTGTVSLEQGPTISFESGQHHGKPGMYRLLVNDQASHAAFTLVYDKKEADVSFSGTLAQSTLDNVFPRQAFGKGKISGDLHANVRFDKPSESTADGELEGDDLVVPGLFAVPFRIKSTALRADGRVLDVGPSSVLLAGERYDLSGRVSASNAGFLVDGEVTAARIDIAQLQKALLPPRKSTAATTHQGPKKTAFHGVLRASAREFIYGKHLFSPAEAHIAFGPGNVKITFTEAKTCDISVPGTLSFSPGTVSFDFQAIALKQQLEEVAACFSGKDVKLTGTFDLVALVRSRGKSGSLIPALEGTVRFSSKNGKIYRYPLLARIFSVLSVTEIFRGKAPELGGSGFPYYSLIVQGTIQKGIFTLDHAYLDGASLDLIAEGTVDLAAKKLDLVVLVAPFSTLNWVIRHIPLVGKILGGTVISVPVKVSGNLDDPDVTFLAPSAVGARLIELLKNILELPVELISPILPRGKTERK